MFAQCCRVTAELWNGSVLLSALVSVPVLVSVSVLVPVSVPVSVLVSAPVSVLVAALVARTEPELCGAFSKFTNSSAATPR